MGKKTMDDTEQTLFESTKLGEYSGYIFLDDMKPDDEIVVNLYIKDVEDSVYKIKDTVTYTYEPAEPAKSVAPLIGKVGLKVTAQQTAGTYREITYMWFKR